ncbi:MAG: PQQ-binding-like beta-propeller repeat protein [Blastocatellia bacterium]|nr:PQQ-binding-like beta-propeller repeat protein [Blastocatellia bacterium]
MKSKWIAASILMATITWTGNAQNWPQFRGANASGNGDGQNPPTTWDTTRNTNVVWKTPIPGHAHASPVVWGNRVFVLSAVSSAPQGKFRFGLYGDVDSDKDVSKHSWKVLCLDKKTGKILWEKVAIEGVPKVKRHIKSTQASPSPATDGKYLVAFFGSEGLYCYDYDGKLVWKQDLGVLDSGWFFDPDYQWGMASSPIIYKNKVIVQCDTQKNSFIAAFDLRTGKEIWRTKRDEIPSWGSPTIFESNGKAMIVTNATKRIRGYDPATGKELFELSGNSEVTVGTPVVGHDLVFVTAGYPPIQPIYAIKPTAAGDITLAEGKESNDHIAWSKKRGGTYMPTPIVYGDHLYTCGNNGVLTCYDAKTGERIYQQRIAGQSNAFSASPIAADGKLYFAGEDGDVFVVKAGPKYELLATNPMGEVMMSTPAISEGMLIVRTIGHVYGIAEASAAAKPKAGK